MTFLVNAEPLPFGQSHFIQAHLSFPSRNSSPASDHSSLRTWTSVVTVIRLQFAPPRRGSSPRYDGVGGVVALGGVLGAGNGGRAAVAVAHGSVSILIVLPAGVVGLGESMKPIVGVDDGRRHQLARRRGVHGDSIHLDLTVAHGGRRHAKRDGDSARLGVGVRWSRRCDGGPPTGWLPDRSSGLGMDRLVVNEVVLVD